MDAAVLLQTYTGQIRVECTFSILKDPYFVDEIHLKNPHLQLLHSIRVHNNMENLSIL